MDEITAAGGRAELLTLDVTDTAAIEAGVSGIVSKHGRLDILVSNAGITRDQLLLRMKREDWDAVIATNLSATFVLAQAALRPMLKRRSGRIIAISSVVGQTGNAGQSNYAASKAGLRAGDVITKVGDATIDSTSDLMRAIGRAKGETTIEVVRDRKPQTLKVTLEEAETRVIRRVI